MGPRAPSCVLPDGHGLDWVNELAVHFHGRDAAAHGEGRHPIYAAPGSLLVQLAVARLVHLHHGVGRAHSEDGVIPMPEAAVQEHGFEDTHGRAHIDVLLAEPSEAAVDETL